MIDFYIYGSPARKSNSRINLANVSLPSKYATAYKLIFNKQIKKIKHKFNAIDLNDENLYWYFIIYYNNKKSDASIELIFDLLQENGIIENDNTIRHYTVNAKKLDNITPRIQVIVYREKNENYN